MDMIQGTKHNIVISGACSQFTQGNLHCRGHPFFSPSYSLLSQLASSSSSCLLLFLLASHSSSLLLAQPFIEFTDVEQIF